MSEERYTKAEQPPDRRSVYRFVSAAEHLQWETLRRTHVPQNEAIHDQRIRKLDAYLTGTMAARATSDGFAASIYNATMTKDADAAAAGWMCTTSDPEMLIKSTDDKVQDIVRNAEYLLLFSVPRMGCVGGAAPLSKEEGEVLVPNTRDLVYVYMNSERNPYNREQASASNGS
jgi:hypothetical protein